MKIDLRKIEDNFNIDLDEYSKFIVTNIYWESIDECEPVTYKIKGNYLYIPNNFFFIAFNSKPASKVLKPVKTIIVGKNTKGYVFIVQTELNIDKDYTYGIYEKINEVINIADAKYSDMITAYKIEHIIFQLPIGLLDGYKENNIDSDDYEKDETENDYDTEVF